MLVMLFGGVLLLIGLLLFLRWFAAADPKSVTFTAKAVGIGVGSVLAGYLLFSGRVGWIIGLFPFLVPFLLRKVHFGSGNGLFSRSSPRTSNVRTRFLEMRLDHETGELDGDVLQGPYAGRQLSAINTEELLHLGEWLRAVDRKSMLLLEAYLDRRCPNWRTSFGESGAGPGNKQRDEADLGGAMSIEDAYRVLGLEPGASEAEIREAHHRLIASVHPDKGGSSFLAAQVNRAKDILLRKNGK